jgi:hypothetical protein
LTLGFIGEGLWTKPLTKGQHAALTPAQIRSQRIANLDDPEALREIEALQAECALHLAEIERERPGPMQAHGDRSPSRKMSRNAPQLTPPGMKPSPVLTKGAEDELLVQVEAELRFKERLYREQQAERWQYVMFFAG